jgi:hypothetical protein
VLPAVDLNDQACPGAIKINDVIPDDFLSVKLIALELFSSQFLPEDLLRIGHVRPQLPGEFFQLSFIGKKHGSPASDVVF